MILTDRTMTVNGNTASLDSNVYLYRGDKNVEINFNIVNSKFRFTKKSADNIIESSEAFYSIVKLIAPNGAEIEFPATAIEDGKAKWLIEGELIDELDEVGTYNIQIRLLNNEKDSIITMPPVYGQVEVSEPLFMDDTAITGVSKTTVSKTSFLSSTQRDTLNPDGTYNKKTWESKELIYESDLNTLEDIASKNRQSIINDEKEIATLKTKVGALEGSSSSQEETLATHTSQISALQNEVGQTSESVKGSYITVSGSKDGSITDIEILGNTVQDSSNLADMQSVGTEREDGLYEMSILSCGKNLFNVGLSIFNSNKYISTPNYGTSPGIKLRKLKTYTITFDQSRIPNDFKVHIWSGNVKTRDLAGTKGVITFTLTGDEDGLSFYAGNVGTLPFEVLDTSYKIQLEQGTVATTYEPYKGNKSSILLPCQLEKVGDVSDRLFRREDGVWCIEKNIGEIVLNGSESWAFWMFTSSSQYASFVLTNSRVKEKTNTIICNNFTNNLYGYTTGEYIGFNTSTDNIAIGISTSKLSSQDVAGFKTWLSQNPTLVKYQLATPQIIELPLDTQIALNSFFGTTHVFTENTVIEPTIKATVPKSLGASVQSLVNKTDILSDRVEAVEKLKEGSELEVTSENGYVVCENTNNGVIDDLKIEGKTLVNLCNIIGTHTIGSSKVITPSKPINSTFRIEFNIVESTIVSTSLGVYMKISYKDSSIPISYIPFENKGISIGIDGVTVTPKGEISTITIEKHSSVSSGDVKIQDIIIMPCGKDLKSLNVSYFEGLKSVGQDVDKIEVLSRKEDGNLFNSIWEVGRIDSETGQDWDYTSYVRTNHILVPSSTVIYTNFSIHVFYYDINKNFISYAGVISENKSFTTPSNCRYIRVYRGSVPTNEILSVNTLISNNLCKQNKKQILIQNKDGVYEKPVLRSVGDVKDTIEKHSDGKYYYHKRCNEVVLNGSEEWVKTSIQPTGGLTTRFTGMSLNVNNYNLVCDKFDTQYTSEKAQNNELIWLQNTKKTFEITILSTKLSSQDVNGFKAWLQSNPVTVVYQLATEEVYECVNLDLDSYEGEASVIFNGGAISPKITFKIASHIANTIQVLKDRINYLENKVIGMFKAVLSGDVQTLAYELYPEDFENNE